MPNYTFTITIESAHKLQPKRLDHFLSKMEDMFLSKGFDLYDSEHYLNESGDIEEEEPSDRSDFTCPQCKGTGEGLTDQTRCTLCHGDGEYISINEIFGRR